MQKHAVGPGLLALNAGDLGTLSAQLVVSS